MEKRCSFELFKSNVCHWLKEEGDIDFLSNKGGKNILIRLAVKAKPSSIYLIYFTILCVGGCKYV